MLELKDDGRRTQKDDGKRNNLSTLATHVMP